MKKIIRLTESELTNLVKRLVNEMEENMKPDYIEVYHKYKNGEISKKDFYGYMGILEKHERQELIDYINGQKHSSMMDEEYESVYSDSNEDISYDIQSVDCDRFDNVYRGGTVDIDEDDTIVIRYCEGDDERLEKLKRKGKKLLYYKYGA